MKSIGGNITVSLQKKISSGKNAIGESVETWEEFDSLTGWLDLSNGDSGNTFNAKIQESTHVFLCDYKDLGVDPDECRMLAKGDVYQVQLIDDPMELHQHMEIFLKYLGGGLNGK